jgi:hypothetical protein
MPAHIAREIVDITRTELPESVMGTPTSARNYFIKVLIQRLFHPGMWVLEREESMII